MSFFWVLLSELVSFNSESESLSASCTISLSVCLCLFLSLSAFCSFTLSDGVWFALLNSLPSPPLPPSTVNKQPEPTPRRASTVHRKQPQLTSPTFQPPLPPLEAIQPEPPPQAPSPATEAEQPGLSGAGGGAGGVGGGGVQVATVHPQIVTQLSAEESR